MLRVHRESGVSLRDHLPQPVPSTRWENDAAGPKRSGMQIEGHLPMIDIYKGRIAIQQNGGWYWAHLTSGLVAVARPDRPNRHHAVCREGQLGHRIPSASRFLLVGARLDPADVAKIDTEKFGFVETIDPSVDE